MSEVITTFTNSRPSTLIILVVACPFVGKRGKKFNTMGNELNEIRKFLAYSSDCAVLKWSSARGEDVAKSTVDARSRKNVQIKTETLMM